MCGGGSSGAHTPTKISGSNCDARTNSTDDDDVNCAYV
jgi:hypothetical protein